MEREDKARHIVEAWSGSPVGIVEMERIWPRMGPEQRRRAQEQLPGQKALLCTVFPYYDGDLPGNLSLYARGRDYHQVAHRLLGGACAQLGEAFPGMQFQGYADTSPYPEVYACACASLGVLGENGLLLTPRWGSYVFCGVIATDLPLTGGREPERCPGCGRCRSACPGQALTEGGLDAGRCLSALTQQRGPLENWQQALVAQGGMAWGCDRCQKACPYNREPEATHLDDFRQNKKCAITLEELDGLGDRAFRRQYAGRAFTWRGIAPLRRNLQLLAGHLEREE